MKKLFITALLILAAILVMVITKIPPNDSAAYE